MLHVIQRVAEEPTDRLTAEISTAFVPILFAAATAERKEGAKAAFFWKHPGGADEVSTVKLFRDVLKSIPVKISQAVCFFNKEVTGVDVSVGLYQKLHGADSGCPAFLGLKACEELKQIFEVPDIDVSTVS